MVNVGIGLSHDASNSRYMVVSFIIVLIRLSREFLDTTTEVTVADGAIVIKGYATTVFIGFYESHNA